MNCICPAIFLMVKMVVVFLFLTLGVAAEILNMQNFTRSVLIGIMSPVFDVVTSF